MKNFSMKKQVFLTLDILLWERKTNFVNFGLTSMNEIKELLDPFEPITLQEMDRVKLMNRMDTKFAFRFSELNTLLPLLTLNYRVLTIEGTNTPHYESLYFDDERFSFFRDHHNGKGDRFKVRIRKYVESNLFFLEIKHKIKGRTDKKRIVTDQFNEVLPESDLAFVQKELQANKNLVPTMWNSFQRITLVSKTENERLTLDFNILFEKDGVKKSFKQLVIAELKQEDLNRNSVFYQLMKGQRIRPYRLSKYCLGSVEIYGEEKLKFNRFKKKLLYLKKINHDAI
jgi:hypothetical protein